MPLNKGVFDPIGVVVRARERANHQEKRSFSRLSPRKVSAPTRISVKRCFSDVPVIKGVSDDEA